MISRSRFGSSLPLGLGLGLLLAACQLPEEAPPPAAPKHPSSEEPAPLPPEETPPPESETPPEPPSAKPVEPGITSTGAPTRGTLPKAVIDEKIKSAQPGIKACYERGLKAKPDLHGTLNINFVVDPEGKVAHVDAGAVDDGLEDAATVECIFGEIKKLEFPKPSGGRVFLNYPLQLEPPKP